MVQDVQANESNIKFLTGITCQAQRIPPTSLLVLILYLKYSKIAARNTFIRSPKGAHLPRLLLLTTQRQCMSS
jgi:hypothetical protein